MDYSKFYNHCNGVRGLPLLNKEMLGITTLKGFNYDDWKVSKKPFEYCELVSKKLERSDFILSSAVLGNTYDKLVVIFSSEQSRGRNENLYWLKHADYHHEWLNPNSNRVCYLYFFEKGTLSNHFTTSPDFNIEMSEETRLHVNHFSCHCCGVFPAVQGGAKKFLHEVGVSKIRSTQLHIINKRFYLEIQRGVLGVVFQEKGQEFEYDFEEVFRTEVSKGFDFVLVKEKSEEASPLF